MGTIRDLSPGDEWPFHYRGYRLQVSPNRDVWWQAYNGTDRLYLDPVPEDIVGELLALKQIGGRIHITEAGQVLTRLEEDGNSYTPVYVGETEFTGSLAPEEGDSFSVELHPKELSTGDLWPSVYDGARYSFVGERVWWSNSEDHSRYPVTNGIPETVISELRRYKSQGGSFRITPAGDVITLVPFHPAPGQVEEQFSNLPVVVQNIIKLRKERGVEMLPIYIDTIDGPDIQVTEPPSLTDSLTDEEKGELASWAGNLGRTTSRQKDRHKASMSSTGNTGRSGDGSKEGGQSEAVTDIEDERSDQGKSEDIDPYGDEDDLPDFDDDPVEWMNTHSRSDP